MLGSMRGCSGEMHILQSASLALNAAPPTHYTAVVIGEFITFSQPLCSQMNCVVLDFICIVVFSSCQ